MDNDLKRTIIVTGGSRGIGRAICRAFAGEESCVYFNYLSSGEEARATEEMVRNAGGRARGIQADMSSEIELEDFFKTVVAETGRIDVLINNAGLARDVLIPRMKTQDWDLVMDVNLKGAFICTRLAARLMMRQKSGRIINITSIAGVAGNPGQANYSSAKAGLIGLTKTTAQELASRNITANAIAPGFIETHMTGGLGEKRIAEIVSRIPLGRAGTPEDVADAAFFLASDAARYITGQVIHVNGGLYM
jgi:3-oxoacyl-[acyl-carrier protein] reductase